MRERQYLGMPIERVAGLKPGDRVRVKWCKDDNPECERSSMHEVQIVTGNDGATIYTETWPEGWDYTQSPEWNSADQAGRGRAYFFFKLEVA